MRKDGIGNRLGIAREFHHINFQSHGKRLSHSLVLMEGK